MLSVLLFLKHPSRDEVKEFLDANFQAEPGQWLLGPAGEHPVVYVSICGRKQLKMLVETASPPFQPSCALAAAVASRPPAAKDLRAFVERTLTAFEGVACDGFTSEFWTLDEILQSVRKDGLPFFDPEGWSKRFREALDNAATATRKDLPPS